MSQKTAGAPWRAATPCSYRKYRSAWRLDQAAEPSALVVCSPGLPELSPSSLKVAPSRVAVQELLVGREALTLPGCLRAVVGDDRDGPGLLVRDVTVSVAIFVTRAAAVFVTRAAAVFGGRDGIPVALQRVLIGDFVGEARARGPTFT